MANFHSDKWVMKNIQAHYDEALEYFPEDRIVGIFCQGSTNYGLDTPNSDVDTKLVVVPSFQEIAMNKSPVSTTHVRANDEHIDFKDIRLMLQTFRKQNLNFLEILFTPYKIVNPMYEADWNKLVQEREKIAHYNEFLAVKAMRGVAMEKYHAMEHRYPAKVAVIEQFGYDPKQLHHLLRIEEYLRRYIAGERYESCLAPHDPEFLVKVKGGLYPLEEARKVADETLAKVDALAAAASKEKNVNDSYVDTLLDTVQLDVMRKAIKVELQ